MFGSSVLDMAIGLMFFYFLLSTLCSTLNEFVASLLSWRAKTLEQGVRQLLDGSGELAAKLYSHPLIKSLSPDGKRPSYIPSRAFATALVDVLSPKEGQPAPEAMLAHLRQQVLTLSPGAAQTALLSFLDNATGDLERARSNIARWFDDTMDRVSGFYKRLVQRNILLLSLIVTTALNGDSLVVANSLWRDALLREAVANAAREAGRGMNLSAPEIQHEVDRLRAPIGWRNPVIPARGPQDPPPGGPWYRDSHVLSWLVAKIAGLLLTTFAVSLGAPFWFDLLNRVSNLRAAGRRPEKQGA